MPCANWWAIDFIMAFQTAIVAFSVMPFLCSAACLGVIIMLLEDSIRGLWPFRSSVCVKVAILNCYKPSWATARARSAAVIH